MKGRILLIDGHSMLHRAFYGLPDLTNAKGQHTGAVYGFVNILLKLLDSETPDALAVAFDVHAPTFRHEMYEAYKGTRKPMPDELREQVPLIKEVLDAMGIVRVECAGLEADDILGTIAHRISDEGGEALIVSGDRDLLQVVRERVTVLLPHTKGGQTTVERFTPAHVKETYGVTPRQFVELKALQGDSSDNIPGVPRVGEKTARELMETYGSIEAIYAHLEDITKKSIRTSLAENRALCDLSRDLATIRTDSDVPFDLTKAALHEEGGAGYERIFTKEAHDLFTELGFKQLLKRFADDREQARTVQTQRVQSGQETDELFLRLAESDRVGYRFLSADSVSLCGDAEIVFVVENADERELKRRMETLAGQTVLVSCDVKDSFRHFVPPQLLRTDENAAVTHLFDTMIAAYLLNPLQESEAPAHVAHDSYMRYPELKEALSDSGMLALFETVEMPLTYLLYEMERIGISAKREALAEYGERLAGRIAQLEDEIHAAAGEDFNINSPKQLGEILFEKMGIPGGKKTKTGYSTAADVLEKLAPDVPMVRDVLEYRGLAKLKSTYADALASYIREDGRIHTVFHQKVTATGRLSSSDPNLQNIPMRTDLGREIRKVFVPEEGCVFVDADYSQIELRILAHMSGDEGLIEAYHTGKDIHAITAAKVFHVPFEEVTPLMRRNAKAVNFGIVYGISAFGLGQDLSITREEAARYMQQYFETYPGVKRYQEEAVAEAKEKGYSVTLYGRRRPIPELKSGNYMQRSFGERVAMNAPIQGTAADIMKIAMLRVWRSMKRQGLKARMLLQIHDELLVEAPVCERERVQTLLEEEMRAACTLSVPLEVDAHAGEDWFSCK
ncbi:MAG: DNA polymerase I [Lachnospiraceae bacterium]|nr:DNA polymerase I [Lachnospiraceae bacterium]